MYFTIDKEILFSREFGFPICCIKEEDIDTKINILVWISIFGETCKSRLIFCKKSNTHPYDYYTEE